MKLAEQLQNDLKDAMKAKDKDKLEALRAIKSAILLAKTEKGGGEMEEADELKMLQKLVKQRKDTAVIYKEQGREDLASKELNEAEVIGKYLPAQMSEEEIAAAIKGVIADMGASSMADMGKVMGASTKKLAGKADGKVISNIVKQILSGN